ncbi:type II TA system antitoxin MqsA family protein [Ensifer oleiphilus]|nr:type II TA system antitoxin MqsA family protein [Ensifer oleiphilus]
MQLGQIVEIAYTGARRRRHTSLGGLKMTCPYCGRGTLVRDTRDVPYVYRGVGILIEKVAGRFCNECNEVVPDDTDGRRIIKAMLELKKKVDTEKVDPRFITTVREKLHLGQKEAEELFGGGINSFSRYETGESKPPLSLVKLFCILNLHPELLIEVRSGCPTLPEE